MLADKPTSFKPLFRHSMETNVIKKGILEVYGLKVVGRNNQSENSKKIGKIERIEPRKRSCRSGSISVSNIFPNSASNQLDSNRTLSKQQQKYLDEFNKKPGQKVFVTVYKTCTEYFAVIYPLKMILSARLPINCINLRTSRLEKLENNLIKLFFGLRDGEFAYSIIFKIVENEIVENELQVTEHNKMNKFNNEIKLTKMNECLRNGDNDEHIIDEHCTDNNEKQNSVFSLSIDDENESIEENNEENITAINLNQDYENSMHFSDRNFFVTWWDALSGNIDINADGKLVNNSKSECKKTSSNLLATNQLINNGKTNTNSNLLTIRTDEHRRRLSLQTIPETDADI